MVAVDQCLVTDQLLSNEFLKVSLTVEIVVVVDVRLGKKGDGNKVCNSSSGIFLNMFIISVHRNEIR